MDSSNYFGEPNLGYERGNGSSSSSSYTSSRKGKKSNSDKPKQPQRGLGVAQLEKIRLHTQLPPPYHHPPTPYNYNQPSHSHFNYNEDQKAIQMSYSSSYSPNSYAFQPHSNMMGLPEYERTNITYGDSYPRWQHGNVISENQYPSQTNITQPFLNLYDSQNIDMKKRSSSMGSESSDTQELDLELRLSLY
ncbi:hypothetical protein MtrunA17_Chr8g0390151 [Medicago truncatula]|uniref:SPOROCYTELESS-like EAR-containing protein n=1 Tax=Medicago truncatula TaxID=3880 RepID=A0A396GR57_MEDTR|nr:hypothetical protein MtrunA17_Chr8g0390151 [Medicago truncatula]